MKVSRTGRSAPAARTAPGKATASAGFQPTPASTTATPAPIGGVGALSGASGVAPAAGVSAVLAAGDGGPTGRAVARAEAVVSALDGLRLAMLEGGSGEAATAMLKRVSGRARDATGDERLEALLDAVDVRAAVELAKRRV